MSALKLHSSIMMILAFWGVLYRDLLDPVVRRELLERREREA